MRPDLRTRRTPHTTPRRAGAAEGKNKVGVSRPRYVRACTRQREIRGHKPAYYAPPRATNTPNNGRSSAWRNRPGGEEEEESIPGARLLAGYALSTYRCGTMLRPRKRKMIILVFNEKETFVKLKRTETAINLGGLITPSNAKKSRTPIYLPTIEFPYLSCQGNSYEEPIMVSFVIVEPGKAHITRCGEEWFKKNAIAGIVSYIRGGLKLFRADSPGFVLDDEDDRHVNDAFPVYALTDADTRRSRKSYGGTCEVGVPAIDTYTSYL
ncbi:hypothetical protein ALC56_10613 [Trachymyrmex septentrionalis]|uniref:Uncharacterized protein n=1 Tax=Trachymyrmex septentrionalis TaxID=34720 RepID=A0A195F3Q3_9HYME|nr:hypothetical protein ALC56_10613 [Trachymyrmex septentrionalis]